MNRVDTRIQSTNIYLGHIIYQALLLVQGIEYEKKDKKILLHRVCIPVSKININTHTYVSDKC